MDKFQQVLDLTGMDRKDPCDRLLDICGCRNLEGVHTWTHMKISDPVIIKNATLLTILLSLATYNSLAATKAKY